MDQIKNKMSDAERLRKWGEKKKKADPNYKQSESLRIEKLRKAKVSTMSLGEKCSHKAKVAERKRKSRAKTAAIESTSSSALTNPYRTPQSLGKAVGRTVKSLPSSPSKKKVVARIATHLGLKIQKEMKSKMNNTEIPELDHVQKFFFRSDIVYTSPGIKDEMVVWENGIKKRLRKYYMTMFLREAYSTYQSSVC